MEYSLKDFVPNHLQFLVDEYDFRIAKSTPQEFIFRSRHCQIYISIDRRCYEISVAASPIYKVSWVGLDLVVCYLLKQSIEEYQTVEIPGGVTVSKAINDQLEQWSELLREHILQIIPLFREGVFKHIEPEFKELGRQRYEYLIKTAGSKKVRGYRAKVIKG